jgi:hypothetical protein
MRLRIQSSAAASKPAFVDGAALRASPVSADGADAPPLDGAPAGRPLSHAFP